MSDRPTFQAAPARGPVDPERIERLEDYTEALATIRAARAAFVLILLLSILLHVGAYAAAHWGNVLVPVSQLEEQIATADDMTTTPPPDAEAAANLSKWYYATELALPLAEFLGQVSCGMLALSLLLAVLVCLSGGLGGVRGSISAFFWTLVLLALLFPWHRWLGGASGSIQIPGVYFSFRELLQMPTDFTSRLHEVLHYVRFLGYPLLALLIMCTAGRRFGRAYRTVQRRLQVKTSA